MLKTKKRSVGAYGQRYPSGTFCGTFWGRPIFGYTVRMLMTSILKTKKSIGLFWQQKPAGLFDQFATPGL